MVDLLDDEETIRRIHDASLEREVWADERDHGARALVEMCKKLGGSLVDATESIVSNFGISEQEAGALVQKYW